MGPEELREWAKRNRNPWRRASSFPPDYDGEYCAIARASLDAAADAWEADRRRLAEATALLRETITEPDVPYAMGDEWINRRDALLRPLT